MIIEWITYFIAIMFAMSIDNLFWIPTSGEWNGKATVRRGSRSWTGPVKDYDLWQKIEYAWNYRIMSVITHWRDIIPAIFTSLLLSLFL